MFCGLATNKRRTCRCDSGLSDAYDHANAATIETCRTRNINAGTRRSFMVNRIRRTAFPDRRWRDRNPVRLQIAFRRTKTTPTLSEYVCCQFSFSRSRPIKEAWVAVSRAIKFTPYRSRVSSHPDATLLIVT